MTSKPLALGALVAGALAFGHPASAEPMTTTAITLNASQLGTLSEDDAVALFTFTLTYGGVVTANTLGYAGGTQLNGNVVGDGGFNSDLALFDGTGALIASNDGGSGSGADGDNPLTNSAFGACSTPLTADSTGLVGDSCLDLSLAAGTYTIALTQFDNDAVGPNFSDGFEEDAAHLDGGANFTGFECSNDQFCDIGGNNRTNAFALDVALPEPATLPLFAAGLLALGLMRRRWKA